MKTINRWVVAAAGALLMNAGAFAADQIDNQYDATVKQAEATYDAQKTQCKQLEGNNQDVCVKNAKAQFTKAKADAKVQKTTQNATKDANADKNDAGYAAAKQKCEALSGSAQDACIDQAKVNYHQ